MKFTQAIVAGAALLLLGANAMAARAAELLRPLLADESVRIAAAIKEKKYATYRVDLVTPSVNLPNASAAQIVQILSDELTQQKLKPSDEGPQVRIRVQVTIRPLAMEPAPVTLSIQLIDTGPAPFNSFTPTVHDLPLLKKLYGPALSPLDIQVFRLARKIGLAIESQPQNQVMVGMFHGPGECEFAGLRKLLMDELAQQTNKRGKIAVVPVGSPAVRGEYYRAQDGAQVIGWTLKWKLVGSDGKPLTPEFLETVDIRQFRGPQHDKDNLREVCTVLALNGSIAADQDDEDRRKDTEKHAKKGDCHVDGSVMRPGKNSPFGVEVLVNGAPRKPTLENGNPVVELKPAEQYTLRISNARTGEAAVGVFIDGLSMFALCEKKYPLFIMGGLTKDKGIDAPAAEVVQGWFVNLRTAKRFEVSVYEKSLAAQLPICQSSPGTINVTFAAAWSAGQPPPQDEAQAIREQKRGAKLGTAVGPDVQIHAEEVTRHIGVVRGSVSIRYVRNVNP